MAARSTRSRRSMSSDVSDTLVMGDHSNSLIDNQRTFAEVEEPEYIPHENIRVEAPADLPGGYQMETEIDEEPVLVTVPKCGALQGEIFTPASACLLSDIHLSQRGGTTASKAYIPVGDWRDGFWDICKHGPCHLTLWNSCCCPLLAAGQLITRLQLTWYGTPGANIAQVALAFQIIVMILVGYFCLRIFVFLTLAYLDPNAEPKLKYYRDPPPAYFFFAALDDLLFYIFFAFTVIVLRNIRAHMRVRYAIPESERCNCQEGCEDVCCSMFCPCFTAAQMMRHTADYEAYNAHCCTTTGLSKNAPAIV